MAIHLHGTLVNPLGAPAANAMLKFDALQASATGGKEVIPGASQQTRCGADGSYDIELQAGTYRFSSMIGTVDFVTHGDFYIEDGSTISTIEQIINLISATSDLLSQLFVEFNDFTSAMNGAYDELVSKIGWVDAGEWSTNPTATKSNEYFSYAGTNQRFRPLSLPYDVDSAAHPDPNSLLPDPSTGYAGELADVSQFVSSDDLGLKSFISANSVSDMISEFGVTDIGKRIVVDDYYGTASPSGSGILFFNVVANSSGAADNGAYVQGNGVQFKQNLPLKPTVKNWGAKGDKINDDTPACEAMYAYKGYIQLSGLNRVTKGFTPKTHNFRMYGEGMWSERTKLVIDHEEIIFTHGEDGKNFQAEGFKLQDLHVVLMDGRNPSTNQHFYKPLCANAWKEWKNLKVDGIGGLMNAWPGDGVDVYCQRWDVDNVRLFGCGAWAGWLGDITVEMKRPIGTICQIGDVDLKAMRGHPLAISWFDMRGWRQIEQSSTIEIGHTTEADQYTNIKSVVAYKSNSPIDISTIWYEPYPDAAINITEIVFCDKWPTSAVDGEPGTVIKINDIEATNQGSSLIGGSSLVRFAKGTYYDVQIATVGSTYSYYIQPQYLAKFEDPLLENKNKLNIKNFFWRYEDNKPIMPMPLPYRLYGHVSIENVATNTNNVISPQLNFDKSPLIYEWYAQTSSVRPDDVNTSMVEVDLSVGIDTVGFAMHKGFFALNVEKNDGVPRIRYLVNALPDMIGAWCTITINYVNVSQDAQGTPLVISNSNGDAANPFSFNEANKNGTGYSTAVFSFQIKQQTTRLDAYYRDVELTLRNNFYIQSITARLGNEIQLNRMFK